MVTKSLERVQYRQGAYMYLKHVQLIFFKLIFFLVQNYEEEPKNTIFENLEAFIEISYNFFQYTKV